MPGETPTPLRWFRSRRTGPFRCGPDTYRPSGLYPGPGLTPLGVLLTIPDPRTSGAPPFRPAGPVGPGSGRTGETPPCLRSTRRLPEGHRPDLVVSPTEPFSEGTRPGLQDLRPSDRVGVPEPLPRLRQSASCGPRERRSRGRNEIPSGFGETHRQSPAHPAFSTASTTAAPFARASADVSDGSSKVE